VARTAREAGLEVCALARYQDHHWFSAAEARREVESARRERARVLLTPKDEIRWPGARDDGRLVMDVEWQWVTGGESLERAVAGEEP
jgi:tetraacyldisaccharide-1-P 4'-kinase